MDFVKLYKPVTDMVPPNPPAPPPTPPKAAEPLQ
jgi:hypothetical protein